MRWGLPILSILWLAGCPRAAEIVAIPTNCTFDGGPNPLNPNHQVSYQVDGGDRNPVNDCQGCVPELNANGWTNLGAGTRCDGGSPGMFCDAEVTCRDGCFIDGGLYKVGDPKPDGGCTACDPATIDTDWSPLACPTTKACNGSSCVDGCLIDGGFFGPGPNPENVCLTCTNLTSTTSWTWAPAGTLCEDTAYCYGGNCIPGCFIADIVYLPDQRQLGDVCKACLPDGGSASDWSLLAQGTPCNDGGICEGDHCCSPEGGPCTTGAECCDQGLCAKGACGCVANFYNCDAPTDCCSHLCNPPSTSDAGVCYCIGHGVSGCTINENCCTSTDTCVDGGCI